MNPAKLIICMTPLQALIARHLIRGRPHESFDLLMLCYKEADNAKFHHYFQAAAAHCRRARYVLIPPQKWRRELAMPRLLDGLDKHYRTVFASSIDNPHVQYPLNKLAFDTLETFDDGSGNLIPSSILYHNSRNPQRRLFNFLRRIRLQTEELRRLSCRHHTLYPGLPNIAAPTVPLDLWQSADGFRQPETPAGSSQTIRILLGQPTFADAAANITLADTLLRRFNLFTTSIIFAVFWAAWHLPLASIKGYYQANLVAEGWQYGVNFLVSIFMFVFIMNWVYAKAGRNIWIAVLFHAVANLSNEIFATHPASKIIQSGLFLLLAAYLLTRDRKLFFQRGSIA